MPRSTLPGRPTPDATSPASNGLAVGDSSARREQHVGRRPRAGIRLDPQAARGRPTDRIAAARIASVPRDPGADVAADAGRDPRAVDLPVAAQLGDEPAAGGLVQRDPQVAVDRPQRVEALAPAVRMGPDPRAASSSGSAHAARSAAVNSGAGGRGRHGSSWDRGSSPWRDTAITRPAPGPG